MNIHQITDDLEKQKITRLILEALPDWFGIPEAREAYIQESCGKTFLCACEDDRPIGFLYLNETAAIQWNYMSWVCWRHFTARGSDGHCFLRQRRRPLNRRIHLSR